MPVVFVGERPTLSLVERGPWGQAVEQLRVGKKLTRERVAKRAGLTPTTYGRIERGHHTLTSQLEALARVFEVPLARVLVPHAIDVPLHASAPMGHTALYVTTTQETHGSHHGVSPDLTRDRELETLRQQNALLQQALAEVLAAQERERRRRAEPPPVRAARPRKSRRS